MNRLSDQTLAKNMLETRERGFSFGLYLRRGYVRYLLLTTYYTLALALFAALQVWPAFYIMLGHTIGVFTRDIGWIRAVRKSWPFTEKVTDWEKIQRLADGGEV